MRKITISLTLALSLLFAIAPSSLAFSDIKGNEWFYADVTKAQESGYITGYPDGTFRPDDMISCAEFVMAVTNYAGVPAAPKRINHWASGAMEAALERGWYYWGEGGIVPTGEKFDEPITRELAVKITMNAFFPGASGSYDKWQPKIKDFQALDSQYYDPVFAAYEAGIVVGNPDGTFGAKENFTRAMTCVILMRAKGLSTVPEQPNETEPPIHGADGYITGGVSENGWLSVSGTQLVNEDGKAVLLRGMSTHGMQWYGNYASYGAIKATRDYGANLFRVAMYTGEGGYISDRSVKERVIKAVDDAIALDMYVIIDWHILSDNNPNTYVNESMEFFREMARRYKDEPAVIYEICNEPNGGDVTWEGSIRPYAEKVVPVIREESPDSVVIVGTGTWSQDVDAVAENPLTYKNVMYALHFYAGTHGQDLRGKVTAARNAGTPIFASEWGTSEASGGGGVYTSASTVWLDFLEKNGISWANWSLCDKSETSAALRPGASASGGWTDADLSESGRFVFSRFK